MIKKSSCKIVSRETLLPGSRISGSDSKEEQNTVKKYINAGGFFPVKYEGIFPRTEGFLKIIKDFSVKRMNYRPKEDLV